MNGEGIVLGFYNINGGKIITQKSKTENKNDVKNISTFLRVVSY